MDRSSRRPAAPVKATAPRKSSPQGGGVQSASSMSLRTLIDLQAQEMLQPAAKRKIKYAARQFTAPLPKAKKRKIAWLPTFRAPRWIRWIFMDNPTTADMRLDLATFKARVRKLRQLIVFESWAIIGLLLFMLMATPFFTTHYTYYAKPQNRDFQVEMAGLDMPNLTRSTITSWVATTVTEIMTFNFANYNQRISDARVKFAGDSWKQFVKVMLDRNMLEKFTKQQMVLTSAPMGVPVITSEGVIEDEYRWIVQVPVLMKYVTNNNKFAKRIHVVELSVIKVPASQNPEGLAIRSWNTDKPTEQIVELQDN